MDFYPKHTRKTGTEKGDHIQVAKTSTTMRFRQVLKALEPSEMFGYLRQSAENSVTSLQCIENTLKRLRNWRKNRIVVGQRSTSRYSGTTQLSQELCSF